MRSPVMQREVKAGIREDLEPRYTTSPTSNPTGLPSQIYCTGSKVQFPVSPRHCPTPEDIQWSHHWDCELSWHSRLWRDKENKYFKILHTGAWLYEAASGIPVDGGKEINVNSKMLPRCAWHIGAKRESVLHSREHSYSKEVYTLPRHQTSSSLSPGLLCFTLYCTFSYFWDASQSNTLNSIICFNAEHFSCYLYLSFP